MENGFAVVRLSGRDNVAGASDGFWLFGHGRGPCKSSLVGMKWDSWLVSRVQAPHCPQRPAGPISRRPRSLECCQEVRSGNPKFRCFKDCCSTEEPPGHTIVPAIRDHHLSNRPIETVGRREVRV